MLRKVRKGLNLLIFFVYNRIAVLFTSVNKNKVIFLSESHHVLDGNLKCIYDAVPKKYKKIVHLKGDRRIKSRLKETLLIWYDMTTAGIIFLDDFYGLTSSQKIRKQQKLIQLWHGAGAYKKFGYSRKNTGDQIEKVHSGYKKYTMAITSSEDIIPCYAEAFGIDKSKIMATGIPRTDIFFDEGKKETIRNNFFQSYPDFKEKKIVLFAPTYRGRKVEDASYNFKYANLDLLAEELGEEYVLLTKWHPALKNNIKNKKVNPEYCNNILDFSDYRDINDLLIICDLLVTDYSSIIFEYSLLNKPVVYFPYDLDEYGDNRGLYYDFDEYVYGKVVMKRENLAGAIRDRALNEQQRETFHKKFMSACDGECTDRIIKKLLG